MKWSKCLIQHISRIINNRSRHYTASKSLQPRRYAESLGNSIRISYKDGICLVRDKDSYWLKTHGFLFEPDIIKNLIRRARHDKDFKKRLLALEMSSDDVERMVYEVTHHEIRLYLTGRKEDIYLTED